MYSLPPEILILIFQECGTLSQACALARTSIYTHRVWQECRPTLAWQLASQEVIAFDDAVMATRAIRWKIALLRDRFSRQTLLTSTQSIAKAPTWLEVVEVMNLQRVASVLENKLRCSAEWYKNSPEQLLVPDVARRKTCYRRMSQLMRADPIVSGEYLENLIHQSTQPLARDPGSELVNRFRYNAGSGDFKLDGERQKSFEQFLVLIASCVLEDEMEIVVPECPMFGPYGEQYWPRQKRNAFNSFRKLRTIYAH